MNELLDQCRRTCERLAKNPAEEALLKRLRKDPALRADARKIERLLHTCGEVFRPSQTSALPDRPLKAVTWNIERGKRFEAIRRTLTTHAELKDADLYFLTEVDWGMARSGNRNVAADLARAMECHAYFAPSYFNFTSGHGTEKHITEPNALGLHGKAILSRFPLEALEVAVMPNATNKLKSKDARLGHKRALIARLPIGDHHLDMACVHLDAFSSPRMRARQMKIAAKPLTRSAHGPALVAGDWNTNTINSSSGRAVLLSVLRQLVLTGPSRMIRGHHPHPDVKYDRSLFKTLDKIGLNYRDLNETGVGTFDLLSDDMELGEMALDRFPRWILEWINRLVTKSGGLVSLKLDWFAGRGLRPLQKKVVRLKSGTDYPLNDRPSDHHPVLLTFDLNG